MKASGKEPTRTLTTADLCHSCPARAVVETVMMRGRSLLWCAEHFAAVYGRYRSVRRSGRTCPDRRMTNRHRGAPQLSR